MKGGNVIFCPQQRGQAWGVVQHVLHHDRRNLVNVGQCLGIAAKRALDAVRRGIVSKVQVEDVAMPVHIDRLPQAALFEEALRLRNSPEGAKIRSQIRDGHLAPGPFYPHPAEAAKPCLISQSCERFVLDRGERGLGKSDR